MTGTMASEANRDEILKCRAIAKKALQTGDKDKAVRFLQKAVRMGPDDTAVASELKAAENFTPSASNASSNGPTSNGTSSNPSGSGVRQRPTARAAEAAPARPKPEPTKREYTPEQNEIARKINRTKDYYEMLGIPKSADENMIKKAYRKMSMKVHPDKNGAPSAEAAFKKISTAYQTLADSQQKHIYDQYGADEANMPQHARNQYHADVVTPEDLFNAFFGGGFEQPRRRVQRRQANQQDDREAGPKLMQLLPMLLIMIFMMMANFADFNKKTPDFQFHRTAQYTSARHTNGMNVTFYVQKEFSKNYPKNSEARLNFDTYVEANYISGLRSDCEFEERQAVKNYRLAKWNGGTQKDLNDLRDKPKPSCVKIKNLQKDAPRAYRAALRYL